MFNVVPDNFTFIASHLTADFNSVAYKMGKVPPPTFLYNKKEEERGGGEGGENVRDRKEKEKAKGK